MNVLNKNKTNKNKSSESRLVTMKCTQALDRTISLVLVAILCCGRSGHYH